MIISAQLNNHDVINYHTKVFEDKKSKYEQFKKEVYYQNHHTDAKNKTKKYAQTIQYLTHQYKQENQNIDKQILRENTLQNINNVKKLNEKIRAFEIYQENQEGVKVFFS